MFFCLIISMCLFDLVFDLVLPSAMSMKEVVECWVAWRERKKQHENGDREHILFLFKNNKRLHRAEYFDGEELDLIWTSLDVSSIYGCVMKLCYAEGHKACSLSNNRPKNHAWHWSVVIIIVLLWQSPLFITPPMKHKETERNRIMFASARFCQYVLW